MPHTSVPRWSPALPVPAHAALVVLIAESPDTTGLTGELGERVRVVCPEDLEPLLEKACVGWHFVIHGTDATVSEVRARLLAAGALDAEITTLVEDSARRRVSCTHCWADTTAHVDVGDVVSCAGCGVPLVVYHHFSRRRGAYMGYRVDAEELP
ncbi:dimethylamine monooxygenase subunit DmmA family protein [Nocardia sp. NPDC059240]|uniref:dimethylamine monooxygenase subunit DmmA family protein n=1 Tax=Nocardia sp. NPDC059240 TaxID=3346786 RepID=UPI0036CB9DB3